MTNQDEQWLVSLLAPRLEGHKRNVFLDKVGLSQWKNNNLAPGTTNEQAANAIVYGLATTQQWLLLTNVIFEMRIDTGEPPIVARLKTLEQQCLQRAGASLLLMRSVGNSGAIQGPGPGPGLRPSRFLIDGGIIAALVALVIIFYPFLLTSFQHVISMSGVQVTASVTPSNIPSNGPATINRLLTCSTCVDDPLQVTIDNIIIDAANGRTIWSLTIKNIGGNSMGNVYSRGITLQTVGSTIQPASATGFSSFSIDVGAKATLQLIFAFNVVKGTHYIFTMHLASNSGSGSDMSFDPVDFMF